MLLIAKQPHSKIYGEKSQGGEVKFFHLLDLGWKNWPELAYLLYVRLA